MHITLGQAIWSSVKPIIKIYLIIGTGFGLSKMNILTADATRTISDIVLTVLLPCLSFNKIVANIQDSDIKDVGIIVLTSLLIFGSGLFFAYIVRRFMPVPRKWYGGILAGGMFPNISDLPIAYLQTMDQGLVFTEEEGEKGVASVIIFLAMFLICVFNCGGFRLIENDFNYNDEENAINDDIDNNDKVPFEFNTNALESSSDSYNINNEKQQNDNTVDPLENATQNNSDEKIIKHTNLNGSNSSNETIGSKENNVENKGSSSNNSNEDNKIDNTIIPKPENAYHGTPNNNNYSNNIPNTMEVNSILTTTSMPVSSILTENSIDSENFNPGENYRAYTNDKEEDDYKTKRISSQPVAYTQTDENMNNKFYHHQRHNPNNNLAYTSSYQRSMYGLDRIVSTRSLDNRSLPSQNLHDIIHEYSNVDQFGQARRNSQASEFAEDNNSLASDTSTNASTIQKIRTAKLTKILTSDATVSKKDIEESGSSLPKWMRNFKITSLLVFFLKNCLRPCSIAVILALIIAFIPWVKALFVKNADTPKIAQAPDNQPALSFIMDYTSYVGAASVPFGLILLGATLGRLKIGKLYPGFWKSACVLVFLRQCIMPIFGVLWCDRLVKAGWLDWEKDKMLLFVIAINWALPTMTTLIYFTASYTPLGTIEPIQMECTSFFLMIQYPLMIISLPFLVSYFLKVQMKL